MPKPLRQLTKAELLWLITHKCRAHGHKYIEHYNCYLRESPEIDEEKVGHLDIETSNLNADFGIILSYCIKADGGKIYKGLITPAQLKSNAQDEKVVRQCVEDMRRFDRIVTYYGTFFDIPYIRSRAMLHEIDFPQRGEMWHTDVYFWAKKSLKIHRRRLQVVCDFLDIESKEHPIHMNVWTKALTGDKKSLNYILTHNEEDVVSLEAAYHRLLPYNQLRKTSV